MRFHRKRIISFIMLMLLALSACAKQAEPVLDFHDDPPESAGIAKGEDSLKQRSLRTNDSPIIGDWYGWWRMSETSGDWKDMYGSWWDCCMSVYPEGSFILYDEDMPKDKPLADGELIIDELDYKCFGGRFFDKELNNKSWEMLLSEDSYGYYLTISGKYKATNGGFNYDFFLRPWGSKWPDIEDELPYYYEDWYLPIIGNSSNSVMPSVIGPERAENDSEGS